MTRDLMKGRNHPFIVLIIVILSAQPSGGDPFSVAGHPNTILPCKSGSLLRIVADSNHDWRSSNNDHRKYYLISNRKLPQLFHQERRLRKRCFARLRDNIGTRSVFLRIRSILRSKATQNATRNSRFLVKRRTCAQIRSDLKLTSSLTSKNASSSQPLLYGILRKRPQWLRFPKVTRGQIAKLCTIVQYTAVVVVCIELFFVLRDVFQEIVNDLQEVNQDALLWGTTSDGCGFGNNRKILSRKSVQKINAWLEKEEIAAGAGSDRSPPPNVAPAWIIKVAQELYRCTTLSPAEFQRILLQLTNAEATFLRSCLLSSNNMADINNDIGGLFAAKSATHQLLSSSLSAWRDSYNNPSIPKNSSPYTKFFVNGNGRNDMVLWGPPGCGKSLLIRAISKSSGLPTLLITPSLMQRNKSLEALFSLIKTLKSCVVVLDDLDGLFLTPQGNDRDHYDAATRNFKNEWLRRWDELFASTSSSPDGDDDSVSKKCVLTVTATSRPWDVDTAAWKRLPNRIYVGLPNVEDRYDMLKKWSTELPPIEESILQYFVSVTEGYIPSDLYRVLHHACQIGPMAREDTKLTVDDVRVALSTVLPTRFSMQYIQQLQHFVGGNGSTTGHTPTTHQYQSPASGGGGLDYFSPDAVQPLPYCENGYCWQTPLGNFYRFQIPVDSQVLAAIQTILLHSFEWSSDEEWDFSDYDDDDDDDFDEREID